MGVKGIKGANGAAAATGQEKAKAMHQKHRKTVSGYTAAAKDNYDLGTSTIEGRIFKPAVFFGLARSKFQYSALESQQSFVDRIMAGALKRPF